MAKLGSQENKWFDIANVLMNNVLAPAKENSTQQSFLHSTVSREFNVSVARLGLSQSMRRHVSLQFEGLLKDFTFYVKRPIIS